MAPLNQNEKLMPLLSLSPEYKNNERIRDLQNCFIKRFSCEPQYFVRVPGRVNLIGEHIDYCGYSVCPMAIQQDILIAIRKTEDSIIHMTNTDSKHEDFECNATDFRIEVESGKAPAWHCYFLCGVKGVLEAAPNSHIPVGFMAAVTGNIPLASGLSSSSALVCAAALATTQINQLQFSREELAVLCAQAERYIGTQGGGMDQAIAFLATAGCAKHIEFDPLRTSEVQLPPDAVFVIAHSLHVLNKAATGDYNQRVAECRLASQIIAKRKGLSWENLGKLADLQNALQATLPQMESLVHELLHEHPYTKEELCEELGVTKEDLLKTYLGSRVSHIETFKLYQRALHVFQEAKRVLDFCDLCNSSGDPDNLQKLGELMLGSHNSLTSLYECSHPQLDQLVNVAKKKALGSRLTGAGWGGCTVSLTSHGSADQLVDLLKKEFYAKSSLTGDQDINSLVFITAPGDGAQIYTACKCAS